MYTTSTQKQHWTFSNEEALKMQREKINKEFIERFSTSNMTEEYKRAYFLTAEEEKLLLCSSEMQLKDFCQKFQPTMPKCVVGTAFHYFKRFYQFKSVMDYHPKEILVTCVYLACKIEEFNVTIAQFVANVKGDRQKATEIILSNELMLMSALKFHLTVHNPYRPIEGFLIDIKARYSQCDPEKLRPFIDEFLDRVLLTNIPLLYPPSQIALAAVLQAAKKVNYQLEKYVTDILVEDTEMLNSLTEAIRSIRYIVRTSSIELPSSDKANALRKKLAKCRNQENNPENLLAKRNEEELYS